MHEPYYFFELGELQPKRGRFTMFLLTISLSRAESTPSGAVLRALTANCFEPTLISHSSRSRSWYQPGRRLINNALARTRRRLRFRLLPQYLPLSHFPSDSWLSRP